MCVLSHCRYLMETNLSQIIVYNPMGEFYIYFIYNFIYIYIYIYIIYFGGWGRIYPLEPPCGSFIARVV